MATRIAPLTSYHTVEPGETLWEIAQFHQADLQAIKSANGIESQELLQAGQVLRIPISKALTSPTVESPAIEPATEKVAPTRVSVIASSPEGSEAELPVADTRLDMAPATDIEKRLEGVATLPQLAAPTEDAALATPELAAAETAEPAASVPATVSLLPSQTAESSASTPFEMEAEAALPAPLEGITEGPSFSQSKPMGLAALPSQVEPETLDSVSASGELTSYQVQPGDTVWAIASVHGLSPEKLLESNPELGNPHLIRAGDVLQVPSTSEQPGVAHSALAIAAGSTALSQEETVAAPQPAMSDARREELYSWIRSMQQRPVAEDAAVESLEAAETPAPVSADSEEAAEASDIEDPHAASLISEVRAMQRQQAVTTAAAVLPSRPQVEAEPNPDTPVNPEFSVPEPAAAETADPQLLAAAPLSSEAYLPQPSLPVGQTVSPELPILPNSEEFMPEAPNRFDGYIWPAQGVLTSGYGWRWGRMHRGIDIAAPVGTPIYAAASGVVVRSGWNSGGYGNLVDIRHPDGSLTRYAHNSRLRVQVGQEVRQGQHIADMGSTGYSTGPHLHFEVHIPNAGATNPMAHLPGR